ncbi:MAG: response regulator [Proteobacteria bacterium]|nr:hybrid sensor histidine kinase/response regulator [Pseudomonadota bacterium]NOG60784.1 response regulator [Pseudomonadota bacterium]
MGLNKNVILEELVDQFFLSIPSQEKINTESLQTALNNIGKLAITAGENGRLGFQDICLLIQEAYSDIVETTGILNPDQYESLQLWRILISNYIRDSKTTTIEPIISFFKRSDLNFSINEEDLAVLREVLDKESQQFHILFSGIIPDLEDNIPVEPSYINEKLAILLSSIQESSLTGFLDIALLFQENISDIASEKKALTHKQNELALKWLNQANLFLLDEKDKNAVTELINILKSSEWPTPLSEVDADILFEMLGTTSAEASEHSESEVSQIESNLPDSLVGLCNQLKNATSKIDTANKQSILDIANITEEVGLAAGELDLLGFQDLCLIVHEGLSDFISDSSLATQDTITYIAQWQNHVHNYLSNLNNPDMVTNMIDYLSDSQWPAPLEHADIEIIRDMFGISDPLENKVDESSAPSMKQMDSTIVTTPDQFDLTITTTEDQIQETLNEILEDVIDTKDILAAPHTISKDLVGMLFEEATMIQEEARKQSELIKDENTDSNIISDSLSQYALHIERFGSACQAAEMDGLHQVSSVFSTNLNHFSRNRTDFSEQQISLLLSWPEKVLAYLENPGDNICSEALANILEDSELPKKLMPGVTPALINLLKAVYVSDKDISKEARQIVATVEDISIELPEDINQELLDGLLLELPGQTEEFSSAVQSLIDGSGDISAVEKAQRVAHTVKGAANTVGIRGIATLTHQLEDIMSALNELNHLPSPALANVFMEASDCLEEMSEALLERDSSPTNSQEVLQKVLDWANRIESEGVNCLESEEEVQTSKSVTKTKEKTDDTVKEDDNTSETTLRVPANLIDEVLRLLGETMIVTSQLQERVRLSSEQSHKLIEHQAMVQNLTSDLEVQVEVNGSVYNQKQAVNQNEVFDSLELEEYNELHTVTHQIVEAAVDSYEFNQEIANDLRELDELLIDKLRLHNEIQDLVMRTRMVPIKTITPRLQRIVRQTCRTTKKQVSLEIIGSDTLIDSNIINKLIDPLMHMLRNAVDHGIESREERVHLKKEPEGKLILTFFREGTQIVVRCKDDGAGLNRKAIIDKAIKHGLIKDDEELSENEINRLILHPGFSTRDQATQTSGRGVGLDVVHTELLAMKGSVHIDSEQGNGCLIELRMPVTLMSSHALLLRHLNQIIAVSNHGIEKILHPSDSQIIKTANATFCEVDGEKLKMVTLESLLNLPEDRRNDDRETRPALLIREEELNYVVYIQEIVDTRDLFVKSMGKYINNIKGILGATILGDGSVVPVIDLPELIRAPVVHLQGPSELTQTNIHRALPIALVVDDSLSARRALAQVIQDAGFDVRTAKDGLEAVAIIENKKPDIILVDMEMPRMNGMELTSHVRGFENTRDIPVIMVTSRSTDKHRKQAEEAGVDIYVTKPFSEDDLLDHVHNLLN